MLLPKVAMISQVPFIFMLFLLSEMSFGILSTNF